MNLKAGLSKDNIVQQLSRWLEEKLLNFPTIQFSVSFGRNGFMSPFLASGGQVQIASVCVHYAFCSQHDCFVIRGSGCDFESMVVASERVLELLFPMVSVELDPLKT